MSFEQIHKPRARQRYYSGETIYILPSKMRVDNMWIHPFPISLEDEVDTKDFDFRCDNYQFYNCSSEMGTYLHYFIKEDRREVEIDSLEEMGDLMCNNVLPERG